MGFLPADPCFLTVSAVNAQTYWTVTNFPTTPISIVFISGAAKNRAFFSIADFGCFVILNCSGGYPAWFHRKFHRHFLWNETSENTLREFPLVIATVAKVSRKRGLWLVVRVKKGDTRRYLHFYSFSSEASYVGMIQIRYTGLGDAANSQPDPSGSPVCLFSFFWQDLLYTFRAEKSSLHPVSYMICT